MFKTAIKLDRNFADSYASLVDLYNTNYFLLPDTSADRNEYLQLQEAYLDTASLLDPNSAEVNYAKAALHRAKNKDDQAFHYLNEAIRINPNNDQYYAALGYFLLQQGLYEKAMPCFDKAIEINPLYKQHYFIRGAYSIALNDFDQGEKNLKKAIEIDPQNFDFRFELWFTLILNGKYHEAEKIQAQTEKDYPDDNFDYMNAVHFAVEGEKEKALALFNGTDFEACVLFYRLMNMKDEAIKLVIQIYDTEKFSNYSRYLKLKSILFDYLNSDPRFQEILAKHKKLYEENLQNYGDIDI
jgi:tetratricopeptide (TPR) repeat protein